MAAGLIIPALMIWWVLDNIAKELRRIANALEASPQPRTDKEGG